MYLKILSAALTFVLCLEVQAQATTPSTPPSRTSSYSVGPITPYSEATNPPTDVLRFRRGERYNSPNSPLPELGEESDPTLVTGQVGDYYRDPMPFGNSDAVFVGTIKNGQAYLSNDKRDIYTEFNVALQEVVKTPSTPYLSSGDTIAIERNGGAVRLPSGKVLIRATNDYSMPLVGKRYLLFLKYNGASTEDYHLLTAYQLEGDHVYRLDDLEYAYSARHHGDLAHPLREHTSNEAQLLEQARNHEHQKGGPWATAATTQT